MQKVKQFAIEKKELCIRALTGAAVAVASVGVLAMMLFSNTTYMISDGENTVRHRSGETAVEAVLAEAGMELGSGDLYTLEEGFLRSNISIRRAADMTVTYYGETKDIVGYEDETLAEVLERLELTYNEGDIITLPLDTMAADGLELEIYTMAVEEQTYTTVIPFETVKVDNDDMKKGATKVKTAGVEGEMRHVDKVTYINGVETERENLSQEVISQPVNEVVEVGTGKNLVKKYGSVTIGDGTITLSSGEVLTYKSAKTFKATAYTHTDAGCTTTTATGTKVRWGTVAVDPKVVPYGTRMFIMTSDGSFIYGVAVAEDCGGAIKGNRIDLYMPTYKQCVNFGRRDCTVYFIG